MIWRLAALVSVLAAICVVGMLFSAHAVRDLTDDLEPTSRAHDRVVESVADLETYAAAWALTGDAQWREAFDEASAGAADAILRAPDTEAAADALHPWTELTPPTNDGQLGWLADHTAMTPTLTRLVMVATAARRRLATLLDHPPVYRLPVTAIPQVLPADLYVARLGGMLVVSDRTGRLFASLCLARRHTDACTWADAANVLGLPAETGVKTARACSAEINVRLPELVCALDNLASALDPAVDYRAREDVVRHLAHGSRWYIRWARTHHRGGHATSQQYAVTWLWTEYAGCHHDTTPGWPQRPPDRSDRARYRRYASRLSGGAMEALLAVAETTPLSRSAR